MRTVRSGSFLILPFLLFLGACERTEPTAPAPAPTVTDAVPAADDCVLTMGWDPWEPYHFEDIDGSVRGIEVDLVQTIAAGAGCRVEFQRDDWATLLRRLREGDVHILGSATATPEREEVALFSEPYRQESFRLYVRATEASDFEGDNLAALLEGGMRLGITLGYVYGGEVTALQDREDLQAQFIESPEAEFNFVALTENHVDGVLEDPNVASAIIRRRGWQGQVEMHPLDLGSSDVSLMFSRASVDADLVERFNRSLAALKSSGEIDRIISRYRID